MLDGVVDAPTGALLGLSILTTEQLAPRDLGSLVGLFPVLRRVPKFAELGAESPVPPDPQEMRRRGCPIAERRESGADRPGRRRAIAERRESGRVDLVRRWVGRGGRRGGS
jgi:hypothetical protein